MVKLNTSGFLGKQFSVNCIPELFCYSDTAQTWNSCILLYILCIWMMSHPPTQFLVSPLHYNVISCITCEHVVVSGHMSGMYVVCTSVCVCLCLSLSVCLCSYEPIIINLCISIDVSWPQATTAATTTRSNQDTYINNNI